jgi:site-specific DNA recombinase
MTDAASKTRPFDIVVVHKLDRFSRDSLGIVHVQSDIQAAQNPPNFRSGARGWFRCPRGRLHGTHPVGMAEFYSKNLAREIRKGLTERIRQGFLVFRPPYGYRREVVEKQQGQKRIRTISRPAVDDVAAGVARRIFEMCDRGVGYKEISKILNNDGFRTAQGRRFASNHIYWILRNKAYMVCSNIISVNAMARWSQ